jgi:hypothetical protein
MKSDDAPMWNDPAEAQYVRELLQAGRQADVNYDVASGLTQHMARVKAGAALPHWARTGASVGTVAAWVAGPIVVASVVAGVWLSQRQPQPVASPVANLAVQPMAAPAPAVVAPLPAAATAIEAEPSAPVQEPSIQRSNEAGSRKSLRSLSGAKLARTGLGSSAKSHGGSAIAAVEPVRMGSTAQPAASNVAVAHAPAASVALHDERASTHKAIAAEAEAEQPAATQTDRQPTAAAQRKQESESRLEREMQMLAVAQRVLSSDPARALRLTTQGEKEFPSSMFSAEREQVGLLALVKLGRLDEARRVGQPFLAKYPNAPWSQRLRHALATGRIE